MRERYTYDDTRTPFVWAKSRTHDSANISIAATGIERLFIIFLSDVLFSSVHYGAGSNYWGPLIAVQARTSAFVLGKGDETPRGLARAVIFFFPAASFFCHFQSHG